MPRSAWFALPLAGFVALAGCAVPPPQQAPPPPEPAPAPEAPPPAAGALTDRQFVDQALSAGAMQIGIGRLAHGKATRPAIRALGGRLIAQHGYENARLAQLARHLRLTPGPPDDKPPPELLFATGADFDREFVAIESRALQDLVALYQGAAAAAQDLRLRHHARESLVVLRHQLRDVETLAVQAAR